MDINSAYEGETILITGGAGCVGSNLTKKFGDKVIFDNACFDIPDNKITYIIGESGSGKTTLLRLLAGLDKDYLGDFDLKNVKIAYVFQEPRLFDAISVEKNLKIVNENSSKSINEILDMVELTDESASLPSTLSGGMKMRISIARALYSDADLYLFDEPFSSLDLDLKSRIIPNVYKYLEGKTIIVVSHDLEETEKYADNIIDLTK